MASKVLQTPMDGTPAQICFRDSTDFTAPAAASDLRIGSPTLVQFDMTSVANNGYRQSDKADLGSKYAVAYKVRAALEFAATPTAGNVCEFYWAPSGTITASNDNAGGVSGADSAYTGYSSNGDASVKQLDFIGNFVCTAQATGTVQIAEVGILCPSHRYGTLVVKNASGASMHSDMAEMNVVFDPIVDEAQ